MQDVNSLPSSIKFPDPFLDMASMIMPRQFTQLLNLCETLWMRNGTYKMAASRIVRYFITNVSCSDDETETTDVQDYLQDTLRVNEKLATIGDDFLAYGNSFTSPIFPEVRLLRCKHHPEVVRNIDKIPDWQYSNFTFSAFCRKCNKRTDHDVIDVAVKDPARIFVKRWNPQDIRISYHEWTGEADYMLNIPIKWQQAARRGDNLFVKSLPMSVLTAIKQNKAFGFSPDMIYHMREDTLAGIDTGGWGVSRILANFAQSYYLQTLKRANEVLANDFVLPFRAIVPAAQQSGVEDPLLNKNLSKFKAAVLDMLRKHRQDPAGWNVLPFPAQYQTFGAEAKMLTTPEMVNQAQDDLLNSIGIPAELYRGTLQLQAFPGALRLFEQTWPQIPAFLNGWLNWFTTIVCTEMNWNRPSSIRLAPVTMADDAESRQVWLQLAASGAISNQTALAPWHLNYKDEFKKLMKEQVSAQEEQAAMSRDMQTKQQLTDALSAGANVLQQAGMNPAMAGQPAQPMGAAMPPSAGMTPEDMYAQAQSMAEQLVQMPHSARMQELRNLREQRPALHAAVKQHMEKARSQISSQAVASLSQGM